MEEFAELMLLGVKVREVKNLTEDAVWCDNLKMLLVDDRLPPKDRRRVASQMLPRVLEMEPIGDTLEEV